MIENATRMEIHLNGNVIELDMSPRMVNDIKEAFSLRSTSDITERHVKYYLINGMRNALGATDVKGIA